MTEILLLKFVTKSITARRCLKKSKLADFSFNFYESFRVTILSISFENKTKSKSFSSFRKQNVVGDQQCYY
ncbi:unnamed protein product [Rotaria socialis]